MYLDKINAAIEQLAANPQPAELYAPIYYVLEIGGKRIRPELMLTAYAMYKEDVESILPNAIALETYHNFTLLHDDLMDKAEVRRGQACVHKKWNDNAAILSGDTMLILAYRLMTEHRWADADKSALENTATKSSKCTNAALQTFTQATLGVCEGQQYDIEFETRNDVTEAEYMEMIRLKTSLLLACAVKIGAQLAGASAEDADALYEYGEKMGLAFQLQDDLLDVYGDPATFGKRIGGDILCNKKTFMLINALNMATPQQRAELEKWINAKDFNAEEKIAAVTAIYDAVNIRALCEEKIEALFAQAISALDRVNRTNDQKEPLRQFAYKLLKRQY